MGTTDMKTFYADDTYLKSNKTEPMPRIHMLGGFVVDTAEEASLIGKIRLLKRRYTHPNMPIKWNFKDGSIKEVYERFERVTEYQEMLKESYAWRKDLAAVVAESKVRIVVACIEAYSETKDIIKESKPDLLQYLFENVLMRLALDASETKEHWQCVLDWPPSGESSPFDKAYYPVFHYGKTINDVTVNAGSLEPLGFSHSLLYARCNHSPLLQLADVIVGAARDHLEAVMQQRTECLGTEMVQLMKPKFRSVGGKIAGYGVVASGGNRDLRAAIEKAF